MPNPGASPAPRMPMEDSYLELLADTLEGVDVPARSQFLQVYFRTTTHLDLRESQSLQLWEEMIVRRRELSEQAHRPISLKTVLMDVLSSAGLLRVPAVLEYSELKRLQVSAVTDPLTGLHNRRLFAESFEKELNRARRYGLSLGVVMLDLHRFKEVNDKYGHPRGDAVLRAAASTLLKALRTSDSAFRIGGDEFALLLPQTDAAQAHALSRRIEMVFAETLHSLQLAFTVSMDYGIANFPQDGDQPDDLIRIADERLYRSKHVVGVSTAETPVPDEQPQEPAPSASPISIAAPRPSGKTAAFSAASSDAPQRTKPAPNYPVQRKAERVSMAGTNAYALIGGEPGGRRARVVDLGFGGVALEFDQAEDLPESLLAVLHVPILPPVRVQLHPVWSRTTKEGSFRFGCRFVS